MPRASDAVNDGLKMADGMRRSEDIEQMVLDIVDAFWTVPNHPRERKYAVGKVRGKFLIYLRTPQGSRGAPFSWGYIFALVARLTQGMLDPSRGRLQVYVDDPLLTLRGSKPQRDRMIKVVMAWVCLGFGLAFAKGQRGSSITWIGAAYKLSRTDISVTIKKERCAELEDITAELSKSNITSINDPRVMPARPKALPR